MIRLPGTGKPVTKSCKNNSYRILKTTQSDTQGNFEAGKSGKEELMERQKRFLRSGMH